MVALYGAEVFRMGEAPGDGGVDAYSEQGVTSVWTKLALGGYGVAESSGFLDTWRHPVRVNF